MLKKTIFLTTLLVSSMSFANCNPDNTVDDLLKNQTHSAHRELLSYLFIDCSSQSSGNIVAVQMSKSMNYKQKQETLIHMASQVSEMAELMSYASDYEKVLEAQKEGIGGEQIQYDPNPSQRTINELIDMIYKKIRSASKDLSKI